MCASSNILSKYFLKKLIKPVHSGIFYFNIFVESLKNDISWYKETCEVLLDYPKIGGDNIKYFAKNNIRNILHANIDVHGRRLISGFPGYERKFIEKLQSHCANMTFPGKVDMTGFFRKSHLK